MPDKTQFVCFELSTACNLGGLHERCPNRSPERYRGVSTIRPMDDALIIQTVARLYGDFGFTGLVGWHYYNEPLITADRMFALMGRIKQLVPEARFLLWSNGTLIPKDRSYLLAFDRIVFTDYRIDAEGKSADEHSMLMRAVEAQQPGVLIKRWPLDGRLDIAGPTTLQPCGRMFVEMDFDRYGNLHLCCYDWRGLASPGSLWRDGLDVLIVRWRSIRDAVSARIMTDGAPDVCCQCAMKRPEVPALFRPDVFAPGALKAAQDYVAELRARPAARVPKRTAIVFVAYREVPASRIAEHFDWNRWLYDRGGVTVYMVTDRWRALPDYARCVVFPETELPMLDGKPVFSLCRTKNAGIRQAIQDGAELVICTDVDMAFPGDTWLHLLCCDSDEARVPIAVMMPDPARRQQGRLDPHMTNTVAMWAHNWQRVPYHDECVGYGADDGILMRQITNAGLRIDRTGEAYHIDHPGEERACNQPGHGRGGCYGRESGFNPDNFTENRKLLKGR